MRKNKWITSRTRPSTNDEKEHLEYLLKRAVSPRKRYLKAILNVFVLWGALLLGLLMLSGLFSYFTLQSTFFSPILSFTYLQPLLISVAAFYSLFSTYKWLQRWAYPYPLISQDINVGQVVDEVYLVLDVCRFQEPVNGGFIYFLKISEKDVFIIYDYSSQNISEYSKSEIVIKTELTLSRAPNSDYYLKYNFNGDIIAISNTYPLNLSPDKWPSAESWSLISWSKLKQNFI